MYHPMQRRKGGPVTLAQEWKREVRHYQLRANFYKGITMQRGYSQEVAEQALIRRKVALRILDTAKREAHKASFLEKWFTEHDPERVEAFNPTNSRPG